MTPADKRTRSLLLNPPRKPSRKQAAFFIPPQEIKKPDRLEVTHNGYLKKGVY